ncbi:hypothetical protein OS121_04365 [Mycolicibacterium mucogenicum]|uniref:hypothetical protein n=1 Tax=Mycolicibacterium mucogenicum TaxID=56689 RepID=UPI00226AEFC5|nr:hypothetical protein [Mycolicibacterium mucogenicum]MCX8554338.1 hypothetical protein [Mycolicibacterium mucogenicum]
MTFGTKVLVHTGRPVMRTRRRFVTFSCPQASFQRPLPRLLRPPPGQLEILGGDRPAGKEPGA